MAPRDKQNLYGSTLPHSICSMDCFPEKDRDFILWGLMGWMVAPSEFRYFTHNPMMWKAIHEANVAMITEKVARERKREAEQRGRRRYPML